MASALAAVAARGAGVEAGGGAGRGRGGADGAAETEGGTIARRRGRGDWNGLKMEKEEKYLINTYVNDFTFLVSYIDLFHYRYRKLRK